MKKTALIILAVAILGLISIAQARKPALTTPTSISNTPGTGTDTSSKTSSKTPATSTSSTYKDGTYNGNAAETPYGIVQVAAVISGGKITNIEFLKMPSDEHESMQRTMYSEPYLKQSAIDTQSAKKIDFVTGATSTSYGFQESLQAALNQAASS